MSTSHRAADSPHPLWKQTTVLRNALGQEEAISVGPDGHVWSFLPEGREDARDQRLENLGMPADWVTAGQTETGAWVVIAAKGLALQYRCEMSLSAVDRMRGTGSRWTPAQTLALPFIRGAVGVRRVYTQTDFRGLRLALIVDTETPEHGTSYVMACSQWIGKVPGPFILLPPMTTNTGRPAARSTGHTESGFLRAVQAA
jgi:hypothetical protein